MVLRRLLGHDRPAGQASAPAPATASSPGPADTATVRRIIAAIEQMPDDQRRYVAGFAYILGRAAHADLHIADEERRHMEETVMEMGGLPEEQAVLVAEMARNQNELYGGTEDYLVTREFRERSTPEQRMSLLRCAFEVGAAEGAISAQESAELNQIAKELDISEDDLRLVRAEFTDRFEAIQKMRRTTGLSAGDAPVG